jgi:glycosyltransferase 2 family protein
VLRPKRPLLTGLRFTAVGMAALLVWRVLSAGNAHQILGFVERVGLGGVLLVLCPQLLALSFEALGWQRAFSVGGVKARWRSLLRVRVATEALAQSLPVGVAFAESAKPLLLAKHCGLSVDQSVAGMGARKVLLLLSQCLYVGGLGALGFVGLEAASRTVIGTGHLGVITLSAALALGLGGVTSALLRSGLAKTTLSLLERVPVARVRAWLAMKESRFSATDGAVSALFQAPPRKFLASLLFFSLGWFMESLDTWLILSVLGTHVSFASAGSLEVVMSLVRNVVFVVPAGLGVQDMGYATCFVAYGVPEAASVGAAFVLLKRGKELFWIAVGYALLGSDLGKLWTRAATEEQRVPELRPAPARA